MLRLNNMKKQPGASRKIKRLGRGPGSGHGKTAGKGHKGQESRSGAKIRVGFEGGQTPLYRRVPKRGFKSMDRTRPYVLNVSDLERLAKKGVSEISLEGLKQSKLVRGAYDRLTILGNGDLGTSVKVKAHKLSKSASEKITKAGGSIEVVTFGHYERKPVSERKSETKSG